MVVPRSERLAILRDRAYLLAEARRFFADINILEVDTPLASPYASIDAHIDLVPATYAGKETRYLHSSPEFCMKRLISEGIGDIYQLSHVFRDGEFGRKHNPEFMMAEWYRIGIPFEAMIEETLDFIRLFLGPLSSSTITYREAVQQFVGIDYVKATHEELLASLIKYDIPTYPGIEHEGRDALLNLLLGTCVEPKLGQEELTVLAYYPSSQAALAKTRQMDDELVAERFEVYFQGTELANGYHELADAKEQRERLHKANADRLSLGKNILPPDERFLKALEKGLPDCCGVAVGFDRLVMLRNQCNALTDVLPFDWGNA